MTNDPFMAWCDRRDRHDQLGRDHRLVAAGRLAERRLRHLDAERVELCIQHMQCDQLGWLRSVDALVVQRYELEAAELEAEQALQRIELHQEAAAAELAEAVAVLELVAPADLSRPPCWRSAPAVTVATHRPVMQSCAPAAAPPLQPGTHHLPQGASTYA